MGIMNTLQSYISILTLNSNGLNVPIKRHRVSDRIKKQDPKELEKKQQIDPTPKRRRELIKIRAELNEIETEELWNRSTEPGVGSLKELIR